MSTSNVIIHAEDGEEINSKIVSLIHVTVQYVLEQELHDQTGVGLIFVSKELLKYYNKQCRDENYYPDILSFKSDEKRYIGDILLCREIIAIQAKQYKVSFLEELLRLIIHGLLHLLGHQHNGYDASQDMLQKQELLLKGIKEKEACTIF